MYTFKKSQQYSKILVKTLADSNTMFLLAQREFTRHGFGSGLTGSLFTLQKINSSDNLLGGRF